ncbi:MAG: sugar transferase, partial [Phascolarctobacterium sp.]|nr:sugar transferase [Phascolarctobacterium sp.]
FMTSEQRKRHTVRPGLTGLAQISGRNAISWEGKLRTDLKWAAYLVVQYEQALLVELFCFLEYLYQ